MRILRFTALVSFSALALGAAACTPADNDADTATETAAEGSQTTVIEREVPADPVVVEREVAVPTPPVVIERDRREGDSTTVRAGEDGIEVETTNR
ncbi:hypothetical protein [Brevundimonas sp.]|uniref:hypothetical protein n=1 Tax=Brevundimonas sp. TaxID=1871086 RepID=UPI002D2E87B3|nr:hypothetical protein [Brevundimonas sp.]HYC68038.1 hypothetical protein [Brevundimonas sp.]